MVTIAPGETKLEAIKELGLDIFVDDSFDNYYDINKGGTFCYLFDSPYNKKYNVSHRRLFTLDDL